MSACFLKSFAPIGLRECDGPVQGHHVVKQQTLKRSMPAKPRLRDDVALKLWRRQVSIALTDSRNLMRVCRRHHDLFHGNRERFGLTFADLPPQLVDFALEHGLEHELYRQFGCPVGEGV